MIEPVEEPARPVEQSVALGQPIKVEHKAKGYQALQDISTQIRK